MQLRILGSSILQERETHVPAMGFMLESGTDRLLLECGSGVVAAVNALMPLHDLAGVLVSHMHFDNAFDLVSLAVGLVSREIEPLGGVIVDDPRAVPLPVCLPIGGAQFVRDSIAAALRYAPPGFARQVAARIVVHELRPGASVTLGPFTVTAIGPVQHGPGPCLGYRVTDGAATFGYSGESGICDAQNKIAAGADLYLCDAMMATDDIMGVQTARHMSAKSAGQITRGAGARHLVLTHILSQDDEWCDLLQSVARRECKVPVSIARVGAYFEIPLR
jgi:ribonuclease BN (tRNA processing enzyme)